MNKWFMSQFPEALFKPKKELSEEYYGRIIHGKNIMSDSTVLFCSLARDIEPEIQYTIARIEALGSLFKDYRVIFYENDSKDKTRDILLDWRKENNRVELILENLKKIRHQQDYSIARTTDMAYYRNKYLTKARDNNFYGTNYTIVLDSDVIGGFSYFGICNSISYNFDVVGSNSLLYRFGENKVEKLYYDTFAFRPMNRETVEDYSVYNLLDYKVGEPPVDVFSCFGGLCIYKSKVLCNDIYYQSHDCDHPTLHKQLRALGYKIYLNPSQIVLYNEQDYVTFNKKII